MKTYGVVNLEGDQWTVTAEPHVLLRMKRNFEAIPKGQYGTVSLAATPENSRDLRWFMDRYSLSIDPTLLQKMEEMASEHRAHVLTLEKILGADYVPRDFELAVPAREYQRRSAELLLKQGFLLNADDLGLGKSCSAICAMTDPTALPAVVVCYPHLQRQWRDEQIGKFAPKLHAHIIKTGKPYELPRKDGRPPDVIIITYSKLNGWAEVLASFAAYIVFDEAQELRRSESLKYAAALHIAKACRYRKGLSATPVYGYGAELWNVMEVLAPGRLGTRDEFVREWCKESEKGILKDPRAFGSYLREQGMVLRRTRQDVGRELPPVIKIPHRIEADRAALDAVKDSASKLASFILNGIEKVKGERMQAASEFDQLVRQATGLAKAPHVAAFVAMLVETGEKVLLAGWHRAVYDVWESRLKAIIPGIRIGWYTGSESPNQKQETKDKACAGELDVIFISLRSGAGLDGLQETFRTFVAGELDWSPSVIEQLIGRLHRDGQQGDVKAYYLISDYGSDPLMVEVLGIKRDQVRGITSPEGAAMELMEADGSRVRRLAELYAAKHSLGRDDGED